MCVECDGEVGAALEEGGEGAAGADGGELAVIADEHQRRAGAFDGEDEAGEVGVVGHAGLVDDDDGAGVEATWPWSRRHSSDANVRASIAGFGAEGAGGLAARRRAEHPVPGRFERGRGGVQCGGLAGAGDADDDRHARPDQQTCSTTARCPAVSGTADVAAPSR